MNELLVIKERLVGTGLVQTINARALHQFLEVGRVFGAWIQERIEAYAFQEHVDFEVFSDSGNNPSGGRPAKEYAISLDMAKELAMVERNDRGKEARQYFIECEQRLRNGPRDLAAVLSDPAQLRAALLGYSERVMALEAKVQEQEPKAQFHDAVTTATNCQTLQEAAKVFGLGPNRLFRVLRNARVLMWNNLPYQDHLEAGRFKVVERQFTDHTGESRTYARTLVTGKGLAFIQRLVAGT